MNAVAIRDPELAAVERLTDRAGLARLIDGLNWLDAPDGSRATVRLRWKPGNSIRIGAVVPTATGPAAVLVAAFAAHGTPKADALVARAERSGGPAHRGDGVVVVPAAADPDLRRLVPDGIPLAYNPARRWVGRVSGGVTKAHAAAPPPGVATLLTAPPPRLAPSLPATSVERRGRLVHSEWVCGTSPRTADLPAVTDAVGALHGCPAPAGLPVLDAASALRAARAAGRAVAAVLPGERRRVQHLLGTLARELHRWPAPTTLVHGDFSPDQVVIRRGRAMLLDLDRAGLGPPGWDSAQWTVAQLAVPGTPMPPPSRPAPVLLLAAALLRAPEPFRRLRPGWPDLVGGLLARAGEAAGDLAGSS